MKLENSGNHHPLEIFGEPVSQRDANILGQDFNTLCPYLGTKCDKRSRMIDIPLGICSVTHLRNRIPICPHRFLEENIVFEQVALHYFKTTNNVILFKEVKLDEVGNFDFVLVQHKPLSDEILDFCVVEFQSDSTTQTGELVKFFKDFINGKDVTSKRYNYGMNTYNTIKLSYVQMMYKGQVMENWEKKIYWILPEYIYQNMVDRFNLKNMEYSINDSTVFFTYDLQLKENKYKLKKISETSTSVSNLLTAFTEQPIPSIGAFLHKLKEKLKIELTTNKDEGNQTKLY